MAVLKGFAVPAPIRVGLTFHEASVEALDISVLPRRNPKYSFNFLRPEASRLSNPLVVSIEPVVLQIVSGTGGCMLRA